MRTLKFTVKLYLRTERMRDGIAPILARVRLGTQKMELSSNHSVSAHQWDDAACLVINHPDEKQMNKHLEAFKSKISKAYSELFIAGQEITLEAIKALVLGKAAVEQAKLIAVAEEHNKQFETLVGIKYSHGSWRNYKSTLKYLKEFVPQYAHKADIPISEVNYKFCEAYFTFLITKKQCKTNGANKQLQRLKKLVNYAIKLGYLQTNPMATFKLEFDPVNKVALTMDELVVLEQLELHRSVLVGVRDVFLLQCYTGLSYSDVKRLARQHLNMTQSPAWIRMERQKTKVSFSVPLLEPAIRILDKYLVTVDADGPLLPVISNQKMNQNLKLIQELAGISKNLTTHLARHTFATTVTLNNGVPIESVSKMLGHTKLSTTQVYAKVQESKIADDMEALRKKFGRGT